LPKPAPKEYQEAPEPQHVARQFFGGWGVQSRMRMRMGWH